MKAIGLIAMGAAVLLFACAPVTQYSIHLRYTPEGAGPPKEARLEGQVVTVTTFQDDREVADQQVLGTWVNNENEVIPFISSPGLPTKGVTKAFVTYLAHRGYRVRTESRSWDLKPESIQPEWGDVAVGGSIEELSVEARAEGVIIRYDCKLKLKIAVADVQEGENEYEDTLESSASYERGVFSAAAAENKINAMLSEAVERTLDDLLKE
jgi:hypothetical protein